MRTMRRIDTGTVVKVYSWGMLRNMWEYFFLDPKPNSAGNMCAVVFGDEVEMGDVHIPEIQPYMISATRDLNDLAPAPGWEWV